MDHNGLVVTIIRSRVGHIEPIRQIEIHLNGGTLPGAAELILDLDIDLGTIKDAFAWIDLEPEAFLLQSLFQGLGGLFPDVVGAHRFFGSGAQIYIIILEPEPLENQKVEFKNVENFFFELIFPTENVGIVLGETTHPKQAVQGSGPFVAVDGTELGPADRELAVTSLVAFINTDVKWAVHRFELVLD